MVGLEKLEGMIYIFGSVNRSCNKFLKGEEGTMEGLAGLSKR